MLPTMLLSFISLCVVRVPLAAVLSGTRLGIRGIWIAIVSSFAASTINSLVYFRWGKWRKGIIPMAHRKRNNGQLEKLQE